MSNLNILGTLALWTDQRDHQRDANALCTKFKPFKNISRNCVDISLMNLFVSLDLLHSVPLATLELRYFSPECRPVPVRVRASAMWFMEAVVSRRWKLSMRSTRGGEALA